MFNSSFNKGLYKEQIKKYQENCLNRHSKASELILLMKHYQKEYLQPIITQYFIGNKSEIWSLSLIVHSKG